MGTGTRLELNNILLFAWINPNACYASFNGDIRLNKLHNKDFTTNNPSFSAEKLNNASQTADYLLSGKERRLASQLSRQSAISQHPMIRPHFIRGKTGGELW